MDLFTTADPSGASMVGLGGIFRALTLSFVGPCTIQTIESYIADRAFISVKGITPQGCLTDINPLEAEVKRAMIRQSERPVLLVDGRKFEQRGSSVIAHVSEVGLVVTADARRPHVEALEDLGVDVQSV
jgi:DeoR family transcriptional regulator of aga operon